MRIPTYLKARCRNANNQFFNEVQFDLTIDSPGYHEREELVCELAGEYMRSLVIEFNKFNWWQEDK